MTCVLLKEHLHNRRWASCVAFLTLALLLSARAAPAPQPTNLPPAASLTRSLADSPPANLKPETLKLETSPAAALREELEARTDDRRIVAELMGMPVEKADSHLPHIASLTRRHVCTVE